MNFPWGSCRKRSAERETWETHDISDDDLTSVFDFLQTTTRITAGYRMVTDTLDAFSQRWAAQETISILDLRCGRGDFSSSLAQWGHRRKFDLKILAVDRYGRFIHMARERYHNQPEIVFEVRDWTDSLFLQAQQFDYVICSHGLHQENESNVVPFLKTVNRLAKRGVVITDWLRDVRALWIMKGLGTFWPSEIVRHDAEMCVRRGFTALEMKHFVKESSFEYASLKQEWGLRFSLSGERALVLSAAMETARGFAGA